MAAVNSVWNPRYLAYCNAHGETLEGMIERDARDTVSSHGVCGFQSWLVERWDEFRKIFNPANSDDQRFACNQQFTDWLTATF